MKVLFVHTNFPGQFRGLASALAQDPRHQVVAIGSQTAQPIAGVRLERYFFEDSGHAAVHPFARRFDREARRAEQVLYTLINLEQSGFVPDVIVAHSGWGETLPLRVKFPRARLIVYCEFFYRDAGQDVHFDAEFPALGVDGLAQLRAKNASQLLALAECDCGLSPTKWQRSTYPIEFQNKIRVIHEGVDTDLVRPDDRAVFRLPNGQHLSAGSEILTYVARSLEPMRGFHILMRALPDILRARPQAQVVIVGNDGVSYGSASPDGRTWKEIFGSEVALRIDFRRVHFVGQIPYPAYLKLLQVSRLHAYLTYPFVLSWSFVEAMSSGCLILGTDTTPVREVIRNGENGLLVPFFDVRRFAEAAISALATPERFGSLRQQARATVLSDFDRRRTVSEQLALVLADQAQNAGPNRRHDV